ncbi:MAG: phosphoadenylyl-sulfate reductase [Sphingomonadales bacterium]|mgnify:CR=1 FL=1|nr:MAG: phosphoadenylyl-sulfate reductase [Sphingomonadales bacterium]
MTYLSPVTIEAAETHTPDVIRIWTQADADALNARFAGAPTQDMLREVLTELLPGRVSVVSSFGTESAVLLHMVAAAEPATPVIFVDTLRLFPETLAYRDTLIARLGLTGVESVMPDADRLAAVDPQQLRWSYDPDGCCAVRKVEPLDRALANVEVWISGRKGFQAKTRTNLPLFEVEKGKLKINPLAGWAKADLDAYFETHALPRHPLEAQGYLSIGCMPCTSVVKPGEDPRAGRWRGWDKTECGIHGGADDAVTPFDPAQQPVF